MRGGVVGTTEGLSDEFSVTPNSYIYIYVTDRRGWCVIPNPSVDGIVAGASVNDWNAKRRFLQRFKRLSRTSGYSEQFRRSGGGTHVEAKPHWKA